MLTINGLEPAPLKGFLSNSDIWRAIQQFEKGTYYNVQASSGKGKSTFLHILYGLRKDFEGQATVNNQITTTLTLENWASLRQNYLSVIFQDLRLFLDLSAMDNVLIKAKLTDFATREQILEMGVRLGISSLWDKPCGQLSYGQRQRVAIIRALCQPFSFLLLDEPFSHLDDENIRQAVTLIDEVCKKQGAGLILCSLEPSTDFDFDVVLGL